jgi:hypothetical protein
VAEFPERIELESAGRRITYVLRDDLYAAHDPAGTVSAIAGSPQGRMPVYALGERLMFPTNRVWVRFAEGTSARDRASDLERAGFRIEESPGYAPHGAFVVADEPGFALAHLDALRSIEGVEVVEPQMLSEASRRGTGHGSL